MATESTRCHPLLEDSDLGAAAPSEAARRTAAVATVEPGSWAPADVSGRDGGFGLLILDGLLMREVVVAGRDAAKLLGPGELVMPRAETEEIAALPSEVRWTALDHVRMAVLDADFAAGVAAWPGVGVELARRALERTQAFAFHDAILAHVRVDERLLILLWHLAERFGRVHGDGVHLSLPLTHRTLGKLVGAARQSVTTALNELVERGLVRRQGTALVLSNPVEEHQRFLMHAMSEG